MVAHPSLQGVVNKFADCGETSLRNFFNFILFNSNTGKFDFHKLQSIQERADGKIHIDPSLIKFYEDHPDPSKASEQTVRDDWALVVAPHPTPFEGVSYLSPREAPKCEIKDGSENMLQVLKGLLHADHWDPLFRSNPKQIDKV